MMILNNLLEMKFCSENLSKQHQLAVVSHLGCQTVLEVRLVLGVLGMRVHHCLVVQEDPEILVAPGSPGDLEDQPDPALRCSQGILRTLELQSYPADLGALKQVMVKLSLV